MRKPTISRVKSTLTDKHIVKVLTTVTEEASRLQINLERYFLERLVGPIHTHDDVEFPKTMEMRMLLIHVNTLRKQLFDLQIQMHGREYLRKGE